MLELELRDELELLTLRDELLAELERFTELLLVLAEDELRVELELLTLRLELLPETLRDTLDELLPTLRELLEFVLLGRSYVDPDCVRVEVPLLTEREELERLDVAGATLLTDDEEEELLFCCDTLRVEVLPDTLRVELEPDTLRVELDPATLRLELLPDTLRLDEEAATLRLDDEPSTLRP